jgi:IS1 family transposase
MNRLSTEKRVQVVAALVDGSSINAVVRMTSIAKHTILKILEDMGCSCAAYHHRNVRGLRVHRLQCDEIWAFVGAKAKNVSVEKKQEGWGDTWTWTALDADSKLILSYLCGGRDAAWAKSFMGDVASRLATRVQVTTDGHRAYLEAVEGAFGMDVDYAMLIKLYGSPTAPDTRYSPGECIGTEIVMVAGDPDPRHISTSYVERQNLTMRMSMRRFTRLTNAFSKKLENHEHMLAIYFLYYNFCRVHQTLRVTPAMEAGITNHVWSIEEMVTLLDGRSILDGIFQAA